MRNPDYQSSSDTQSGRLNDPEAIQLTVDSNISDIFDQIAAGSLDTSYYDTPPHTVVQHYATDPALKGRMVTSEGGLTEYFQMNLTVRPSTTSTYGRPSTSSWTRRPSRRRGVARA